MSGLPRALEDAAKAPRAEWPPVLLRKAWESLASCADARRDDPAREARWLNLAGYFLRPGFGAPVDDWRIDEIWKLFPLGVAHSKNELCRAEWWILWRRIAGGLSEGRQTAVAEPLVAVLKGAKGRFACGTHEAAERWRLLAALERLAPATRHYLARCLVERIVRKGWGADHASAAWALGRLAARVPFYGPLHAVLPPEDVTEWLDALMGAPSPRKDNLFEVALMARRTGDRYRDLDAAARRRVADWLRGCGASDHVAALVEVGGELEGAEQAVASGDTLPMGLSWPSADSGA